MIAGSFRRSVLLALGASAGLTLVIRAVGLANQGVITSSFGAGARLDGFFIALLLPAIVVTPLATAVEASISPAYAALLAGDATAAAEFRRRLIRRTVALGTVLSAIALAALPVLVWLTSPGADAGQHRAAERAALFIYPSILPQLVTASASAVLFGQGRFQAPIVISGVNPVTTIVALVVAGTSRIEVLAGAVLGGYVLEAMLVTLIVRWRRDPGNVAAAAALRRAFIDLRPLVATYFLLRAVPVVDQMFASSLSPGTLTRFALAGKLFEVAAALLILPNARMAATRLGRVEHEQQRLAAATRIEALRAGVVGVASSAAFLLAAPAVVILVYRHGAFTDADAWATIRIAWTFAVALAPLGLAFVLPRVLLVLGARSVIPVLGSVEVVANLVLDAVLVRLWGGVGLALATGITYLTLVVAEGSVVRRRLRR